MKNKFFYEVHPRKPADEYRSQAYLALSTSYQLHWENFYTFAEVMGKQLARAKIEFQTATEENFKPKTRQISHLNGAKLRKIVLHENPQPKLKLSTETHDFFKTHIRFDVVSTASPKRLEQRLEDAGFVKGIPQDYF